MLRGVFQGGECVELLYPRGKDSLKGWKAHDRVSREFDAGTKGFVVSITGGPTARLEAPDAPRSNSAFMA